MTKVNGNNNVSAEYKIVNGKKVKKQEQSKNQKQVFNNKGQKTPQKPNDSAIKQEVYKKSGYQLKDTKDRNKIIQLKVNGKIRSYKTVGTLTTGGRILVQDAKGAYHVVSHTKDNKLIMLKDDYAKNKIFYESTSSEHKVKYGKKNYVITNSKRDRHGRMSAIDQNGKRVVLSSDGKELKTGYVEAEDQKDNMNDYIAKQTKGKSKAEADKIRQQILSGNSSYSNKGVLRFKASNGEVWYYDTKRKTYVKYAEKEAQAIIKNLDKGASEDWGLFRSPLGMGTDYELLKNTNAQIIDPEVLGKVNKHYSAEYSKKVDKNAQYGSGKYRTAYEAFLASEIGDDEVYQFNATLVKNNAITDQSRRNEILQTNLTKVGSRANRLAAADAASRKEDYQTLQDAAEEENKKKNYKAPFKGSDALQTYIYGVNNGDVQEIDDFNTTLIDPKEDMIDRDEIVKIKAETGVLWAKKGKYDKAFEAQDGEIVDKMFALQDANGKASLNVKELKAKAKGFQGEYLMFAKPELFTEQELADKAVSMLTVALDQFDFIEKQNSLQSESVLHNLSHSRSDVVASAMSDNGTKNASKNAIEASISKAYTLIRNDKVLNLVKQKMGDKFNLLQKKEQAMFKTNTFANVTTKNDNVKSNLSAEEVAQNKYVVSWLKNQLEDLERDKKMNEAKEGWKQTAVDAMRTSLRAGETRESLANKYDLIKSNMARLEAAAEGKLVDKNGKPVSFEDAMKNLGETGIKALEKANQDYQSAQATGEFVVDMAVLAIPIPGLSVGNIVKMSGTLYKVVGTTGKMYKVVKVTEGAVKGQKIINYVAKEMKTVKKATELAVKTVKEAEVNGKFAQLAVKSPKIAKALKIADSSATGAMHMAGKTFALEASNIATSREGFTSDRNSEMNTKTQSAAVFGGMGGFIGGTTAVASEFVSSAGAKYAVHGVGLVADLMGAAGLMTAESHGETNFWDNLRCVNPDGSFNFEQASMTAMMIFGHLHGMSAIKGKPMPKAEIQADGTVKGKSTPKAEIQADDTVKYTLNNRELVLSKDGIFTDSETGRKFKLATNKNGKAELTELTKKEVAARHSEAPAEESRGTSTQQIKSFKERINNAKTREELNAIRSEIKKTDLTVQERNELMKESLKVQREWGQAPERRQIVNMATEGDRVKLTKKDFELIRKEYDIRQTKKGSKFVYEDNDECGLFIKEQMRNGKNVVSYYCGSNPRNGDTCLIKYNIKNSKAENVVVLNTETTPIIQKLYEEHLNNILRAVELKQTGGEQVTNKNIEKTTVSNDKKSVVASESEGIQPKPETEATGTKSNQPVAEQQLLKPAESDVKYEPLTTNEPIVVKARANSLVKDFGIKHTVEGSEFDMMGGDSLVEYKGSGIGDDILKTYNFTFDEQGRPFLRESSENISWHGEKYTIYRDAHENITEIQHEGEYYKPKNTENGVTYVNEHGIVDDFNYILKKSNQPATDKSVVAKEAQVTTEKAQKTAESNSETYNPEQRAEKLGLKPSKEGNRIDFETFIDGEHPQFVEVDSNGNPVKRFIISLDQNGKPYVEIRATYENGEIVLREQFDEFGEVVAREYADIPVNLSDVDNFLKEYPDFVKSEADGVVTIRNKKANLTIEYDKNTGKKVVATQVDQDGLVVRNTFNEDGFIATRESDFVYEGNRYHEFNDVNKGTKSYQQILDKNTGISTEVKPELAKKFAEGTVDDGKFTPKGVNEDANMGEEVFSPYEVIEQNAEGKPTKTVLKNIDGKVLEYNYNEYDSNGNVAKTTSKDATGKVTASHEFEYDSSHNLTKETVKDADGKITGIYDGKGKSLEIPESKIERKSVVEESQVTGEQKKSSLILPGDERKPVKIKTAEEFAKEENKPVQIKTEEEFAKEDGHVEIDSSNTTTEEVAKQPIKLDLDTKSSGGDIDAKSHYEVMADKVIVDGEEFPIPQTLEEAKNTKALRYWGGGKEYSIEYTSDFANSTNRVILKYDTESGKFIGSREEISINGKALKETSRNADGTIDYTHEYLKAENGQAFEVYRDSNGKPTSISQQYETHKKITFDKEGKASYEVTNEKNETVTKPIEEAFKDYPELKPLLKKQGIKLVEKKAEKAPAENANAADQSATGNTPEEAAQNYNEEMNNVEPTSTAQVKNLEKYDIMFQSKEGKALLDKAKKDPNFGKSAEERVPSDKIVKDADGNIQSIEIDGVTYTRNEQGEYVNEKGDSQIQIETPDQDTFIIDPRVDKRITMDRENNKIIQINSDDMTIKYDSNGQPERVSSLGNEIYLSTGNSSQDFGSATVDPTGRVIRNEVSIDIEGRRYEPYFSEGSRYSDWNKDTNGQAITLELRQKTRRDLSKQIEDAQLENKGLSTTKKGRQKAYDDVRNQIEDAYNNNKISREDADNLHAELNEKAKANGLETQETPTMKAEREALAKWNEQVDALKNNLMSEIAKVDSQATHDQMVEKIGEACKNGEIDMKRANELYDALEAKANSIDGVESLAQKAERINAELKAHENKSADEASNIHNEAESGAITGDETPVTTEESTPVSENSKTADAKPSKISMFDKLFHRNKAKLEKEVASGEEKIGDYKFNTVKDENGYVRTKTNNTGKIEGKEYFNAKGKKIKTEEYNAAESLAKVTEGNVTTEYNADGTINNIDYPHNKNVEFTYDENGNLIGAEFYEWHNPLHPKNWNDSEFSATKRCTNYKYNSDSDKPHFELVDENGKVVTDKNGKPVGTATFDPETRHWVEEGQYSSDLAPKTTNVSRGEGRFRIKLPERNKVPKNLRDENGNLREGVKPFNDGYTETISKEGVEITKAYDSKGTLLLEASKEKATYYNAKGEVIAEEKPIPNNGVQRTEFSKDYDLDVLFNSQGDAEKITIKYHKDKKGNIAKPEEFIYDKENKVYKSNDKDKDGKAVKTLDYDAKNHSWTIRDGEGKKLDSQNNMKESHIKRNLGIGAGVLTVGGVALYGVSKLTKSDDDKDVKQPVKPTAKPAPKKDTPAPKAETKVTLDGKEGTIAEDGTLTLDGKKYPKDTDGTYTIGDKKYKVEDGKLVEVVDTPDDNGETGGTAPDESPEVKGTVDGKEYTIKDGTVTIDGDQFDPHSDGFYYIGNAKYTIGADGKLVKADETTQSGSAGSATQTGSDSAQAGNTGTTSQQTGNTNTTGNNTHVTAPAQPADSSASTRTTGTTHNDTSVTTRHTNVPAEESRANSSRPSERSEESRHTGNTPVTGVTEPTEAQKQFAKTLQKEISGISTQADVKAFFTKLTSAVKNGQITIMQSDELLNLVNVHVETLVEVARAQNEQDAIQKPEFGLGEVTTPQEPQRKEKQEITPVERMELTKSIRNAQNKDDIAKIQREMRKYKVFPGRKNLRRAYKAKLRAIKHQDEPQKVEKYNKKFEKRMDKIEDSKVYKNDEDQINRENFQKMKYFDDIIKRPKDFDDGIFNA